MIVIARLLEVGSLLFWILMVVGVTSSESDTSIGDAILGGVFLTIVPAGIAVLLEVRFRRARRRAAA